MASKLKVDELRAKLASRGLDTKGTKSILIRRLETEIDKERMASSEVGNTVSFSSKKRRRESKSSEDYSERELVTNVETLCEMGVQDLRKQAALRGISTNGSKKALLERLVTNSEENELQETPNVQNKNFEETKKEKLVKATKKGDAVLDQWLPDDIKLNYHVLQQGGEIYDAILNQTNVGENNNKFYVIQALESDNGGAFMVYNRWGRVGVKGQDKLHGPYKTRDEAINEFELKFFDKTKNEWSNRKEFVCYPKRYTWLEMDYSKEANQTGDSKVDDYTIYHQPRETKLDPRIAKLVSLICNINMMKQHMLEIGYNAEKLPLGKLSKSTIHKGYKVLKKISDVMGGSDRKVLELLSGEFYTVIPHDFGFKKMREFVIDTPQKLKCKLQMVEALGEIEIATKLLKDDIENEEDPLYSRYKQLLCELSPLEADSKEFSMISEYMRNTHAKTHSNYAVDIIQIFRVSRHGEDECFRKFSNLKNRMLLWHGSRLTNWTGILSQGLRIAPPEAPVTGYMFGKGVYFADMFSKSANYCYASQKSSNGLLLLCEVALGDMVELFHEDYNADQLPEGKQSTKGLGETAPDPSGFLVLEDGVIVPLAKPKKQLGRKGTLLYNEYIVYNTEQIRMRYVIHVSFNFKR